MRPAADDPATPIAGEAGFEKLLCNQRSHFDPLIDAALRVIAVLQGRQPSAVEVVHVGPLAGVRVERDRLHEGLIHREDGGAAEGIVTLVAALPERLSQLDDLHVVLGIVQAELYPLDALGALTQVEVSARRHQEAGGRVNDAGTDSPLGDEAVGVGRRLPLDQGAARHTEGHRMSMLSYIRAAVVERVPVIDGFGQNPFRQHRAIVGAVAQLVDDTQVVIAAAIGARGIHVQEASLADLDGVGMSGKHVIGAGFAGQGTLVDQLTAILDVFDHWLTSGSVTSRWHR